MPSNNIDVFLRVLNSRRFQGEMRAAGRSAGAMGKEFQNAAAASSGLTAAGSAATGMMYGLGAATRVVGYGIGALAAATLGFGIKFNSTMEANTLAFEHFAGNAKQAKALTLDLFDMARNTPFSFENITTAARRFLAFGFTIKQTKVLLGDMADTMAISGAGTDEIMRFAKALGDIRAKGRLMQQEMNQLANLNIPIREILAKGGLELTRKQLLNVGRAGIPAERALEAIHRGLQQVYGGGAKKYLETFNGQWQRFKDNVQVAAGQSTTGIFGWLKDGLKSVNDAMQSKDSQGPINKWKAILEGGLKGAGGAFLFVKERVQEFLKALKPAQPFFENILLPLLKGIGVGLLSMVAGGWNLFIGVLNIVAPLLGWLGEKLAFLKPVFFALGYVLSFFVGGALVKVASWLSKFPGIIGLVGRGLSVVMLPFRIVIGLFGKLWKGVSKAWSALRQDPFTAIQLGFLAVRTWLGKLPGFFLGIGKKLAKAMLAGIVAGVSAAGGFVGDIGRKVGDWLNAHTPFGDKVSLGPLGSITLPALATGGYISAGGYALVGERGPEIAHFPTGASIAPIRGAGVDRGRSTAASTASGEGFAPARFQFTIPVVVNRREIGRASGEYTTDRRARK